MFPHVFVEWKTKMEGDRNKMYYSSMPLFDDILQRSYSILWQQMRQEGFLAHTSQQRALQHASAPAKQTNPPHKHQQNRPTNY
jgi:hypothetical protein